jgi:divalent metal cation (Fe/Co/Zn/Cd) transporter
VLLAFFGNAAITLMKAAMWWRSGSSAMLAETVHTLVRGRSARAIICTPVTLSSLHVTDCHY